MRIDRLYIASASMFLPPKRETADLAVSQGRISRTAAISEGFHAVAIYDGLEKQDLALPAAREALAQADWRPDDLDLVLYATAHENGKAIVPQYRLARRLGATHAVALGIQQTSSGGAAGIATAAALMCAQPDFARTLVATADSYTSEPIDRWRLGWAALGDGGGALLLCRDQGTLALRSVTMCGRPMLEEPYPGYSPLTPSVADSAFGAPLQTAGKLLTDIKDTIRQAVDQALTECGLAASDPCIRVLTTTRYGRTFRRRCCRDALPAGLPPIVELTGQTGHIGAGDLVADIAHITANKLLEPGDFAIVISIGMGFTASCLVLEETTSNRIDDGTLKTRSVDQVRVDSSAGTARP